ncbi:MAG TPA: hypothetical protein VHB21_08535, partial [Minicystis sp.]|nr:hypothetical protein [Minicystis sp.]
PGTLYLVELGPAPVTDAHADAGAHGMTLPAVFAAARAMGAPVPRALLVGCEPEAVVEGMGLPPAGERAVDAAAERVRELLRREGYAAPAASRDGPG